MRIQKRNIPKKTVIISILAALLIAGGTGAFIYLYKFNGNILGWQPYPKQESSSINYQQPTPEQKKAGEEVKQGSVNSDPYKPSNSNTQPPVPTPQPSGKGKVDITITAANQNGGTLQIRSDILAVTNSGTCTLTLTKSSQVITKTAGVQALSSSSTCQGFDISTTELSPGAWTLALHFENSTLVADTTKTVTVQ